MSDLAAAITALARQARGCVALGSAFSGGFLDLARSDAEDGGPMAELLALWAGADERKVLEDAAPLRLLGAFHDLALSGEAPALAAWYPAADQPGDPEAAFAAALAAYAAHRARLLAFMDHEPQTNETGRAACVLGGFLTVAAETALPLRLFEIGASAGLNQNWHLFHHQLGWAGEWGDPAARVRVETDWQGPLPPIGLRPRILSSAACDRRPVRLADPALRQRLLAYVWPDQLARLARLCAAIDEALAQGTEVEEADALAWVRARVAGEAGAATVVFHSTFWGYLPEETKAGLRDAFAALGAAATADAPFAWLRMEPEDTLMSQDITLTLWPGGETRRLAEVHPHGAWVRWCG